MPKQIKKMISIDVESLDWLEREYPDWSLQWTVNKLLCNLMEVSGEYTPSKLAKLAAMRFKTEEDEI